MFQLTYVPGDVCDCPLLTFDFIVRFILLSGYIVYVLPGIVIRDRLNMFLLTYVRGDAYNYPL